ncbi:hypothetical protein F4604DRAFT_1672856 [Suillus subluteus]|nr:hypothetical protein F4604DRAFT_1672856 [Suillus subluteus]
MLEDAWSLQGNIAHANHDVYPEAQTLFCEVIVCMSRKREGPRSIVPNQPRKRKRKRQNANLCESDVLRFPMTDCLALNDARECACLEAGGIASRRWIDSREQLCSMIFLVPRVENCGMTMRAGLEADLLTMLRTKPEDKHITGKSSVFIRRPRIGVPRIVVVPMEGIVWHHRLGHDGGNHEMVDTHSRAIPRSSEALHPYTNTIATRRCAATPSTLGTFVDRE